MSSTKVFPAGEDTSTPEVGAAPTPPFREVFDVHAPHVFRTLRRLGVREADTADVCQEVFVVVHRRLADFDGTSSLRTWIYGIALRVASQYRKRAYRRREELAEDLPDTAVPADQEGSVDRGKLLGRLEAALGKLDDDKRAVFILYELEELTMTEVAEVVGCPLQTAYSRLHAARAIVKKAFTAVAKERST
jgi:RNA polymerase sigma-70 factor (ECF subfamily)